MSAIVPFFVVQLKVLIIVFTVYLSDRLFNVNNCSVFKMSKSRPGDEGQVLTINVTELK